MDKNKLYVNKQIIKMKYPNVAILLFVGCAKTLYFSILLIYKVGKFNFKTEKRYHRATPRQKKIDHHRWYGTLKSDRKVNAINKVTL